MGPLKMSKWIGKLLFDCVVLASMAQIPMGAAFAQTPINVAPGYEIQAAFLSPAPDGSTSVLLHSRRIVSDPGKTGDPPPLLEVLTIDPRGAVVRRSQLDNSVIDTAAANVSEPACRSHATAAKDGGFILMVSYGDKIGQQVDLASVFRLAPDGHVLQRLDFGQPDFLSEERREYFNRFCIGSASQGPDGSLVLTGEFIGSLGIGNRRPWWAVFDSNGQKLAEVGRDGEEDNILALRLGQNDSLLTVRSREIDMKLDDPLGLGTPGLTPSSWAKSTLGEVSLRTQSRSGAQSRSVVLGFEPWAVQALFTTNELVAISTSHRCSYLIDFYSIEGRHLRSREYYDSEKGGISERRTYECHYNEFIFAGGDHQPEIVMADGAGFLALIAKTRDDTAMLAGFDREGRIVWRSPSAKYLDIARRADGRLVALEQTAKGPVLRNLR